MKEIIEWVCPLCEVVNFNDADDVRFGSVQCTECSNTFTIELDDNNESISIE